ncbi:MULTISPECIES: ABC transporter ATP-binding protein [Streptomycetaceae]|uniref:ABC-type quaternary amine transporter n=1 Tax=Streptantibioticus cattleyicolor (strain ATCC 35852 / DSM 46488 / JCM 4925 / NBRC 14057 / NRRL 8057) TaxID=1003195 RepID=F8JZQ4_STREN|nr:MULTISPECIES: ABC transporter ATP-binding protein [Streptomycetaceae]AEW94271.1 ABC transporter related protein [Streptantibioticus cattleyicolor NRRL 8057 = DSM 46488]MYS58928.1 ATP-binding cassette domain-containing protein [Streptomyces sp. SID5468]CCB74628.1 putative 2-aminoethylphosphonate import ATP-binding protein phnT [Streptantibioticus cattleyicolor NRRL 8057 = DSM 46488]
MPAAPNAGIRFDAVTVRYGAATVLDRFDLTVAPGEVMALLGPSGSGKTTALRAVAGFVTPASGRVLIGDRDVTRLPPHRRGIGMVVQSYALFPHMRVEANVAFGLKARRVPRQEIAARVAEALEMTGMSGYARRYPRELSGGQQQRVAIARALAVRPGVLLLDEPLSALDARLRSGMLAELARLHRELPDVSILYVTHDQIEALTLADRIAVLDSARLRDCGTPRQLYRTPATEFTASFVGSANLLPVTVGADGVDFAGHHLKVAVGPAAPGATATLCVRPHLVGLGEGPNALTGTVREVQWRGATHRLLVEVGGHRVMADVRELREPPAPGHPVTVHFAAEDAVLLAAGVGDG